MNEMSLPAFPETTYLQLRLLVFGMTGSGWSGWSGGGLRLIDVRASS